MVRSTSKPLESMTSRPKRESKQTSFFTVSEAPKIAEKKAAKVKTQTKAKKEVPEAVDVDTDEDENKVDDGDMDSASDTDSEEAAFSKAQKGKQKSAARGPAVAKAKEGKNASAASAAVASKPKGKGKGKSALSMKAAVDTSSDVDIGSESGTEEEQEEQEEEEDDDEEEFGRRPRKKPKTAAEAYLSKSTKARGGGAAVGAKSKGSSSKSGPTGFTGTSTSTSAPSAAALVFNPNKTESKGNELFGLFFDASNKTQSIVSYLLQSLGSASKQPLAITELMNFVLLSAGASKNPIPVKANLDGLNNDEVFELYEEHFTSFVPAYPLQTFKGKTKDKHWRVRYSALFAALTSGLLKSISTNSGTEGTRHMNALQVLVEHLVGLTASSMSAIRDAATLATMTIGATMVSAGVARRAEVTTLKRLLTAEAKGSSSSKVTAKQQQLQRSVALLESAGKALDKLTNTIFLGVLVTRYKDVQPAIRKQCMVLLGDWIAADHSKYFKDEYIKYFGWMLVDQESSVRLACLESLISILAHAPNSKAFLPFFERFATMLASMAKLDVDDNVRAAALQLFLLLEEKQLLDTVDQEVLDAVDSIVFDAESSVKCRAQALVFMMDHTEGFEEDLEEEEDADEQEEEEEEEEEEEQEEQEEQEEEEEEEGAQALSGRSRRTAKAAASKQSAKGASSSSSSSAAAAATGSNAAARDAHKRRQQATVQLETLCEFVAIHLPDSTYWAQSIPLLVGAFGQLSDKRRNIVRDWSTIAALLLKEHDDLVSSALRPQLVHILLYLFVASVQEMRVELNQSSSGWPSSGSAANFSSCGSYSNSISPVFLHVHTAHTRKENNEHATLLAEVLRKDLTKLLTRSRDDPLHIMLLCELLESIGSGGKGKAIRPFLKQVTTLFDASQSVYASADIAGTPVGASASASAGIGNSSGLQTINTLVCVLRYWKADADTATSAAIDSALSHMMSTVWGKIGTQSTQLHALVTSAKSIPAGAGAGATAGRGKSSSSTSTSSAPTSALFADTTFDLSSSLSKLVARTKSIDCTTYWPAGVATVDVYDRLEQMVEVGVDGLVAFATATAAATAAATATATAASDASSTDLPTKYRGKGKGDVAAATADSALLTAMSVPLAYDLASACTTAVEAMLSIIMWAWHDLSKFVASKIVAAAEAAKAKRPKMLASTATAAATATAAEGRKGAKRGRRTRADVPEEAAEAGEAAEAAEAEVDAQNALALSAFVKANSGTAAVAAGAGIFDDEELEHIGVRVDHIDSLRVRLVDVLVSWMSISVDDVSAGASASAVAGMKDNEEEEEEKESFRTKAAASAPAALDSYLPPYLRSLQRHAFTLINDLRVLFPPRFSEVDVPGFDRLSFKPSPTVFKCLREVFEEEGRLFQALQEGSAAASANAASSATVSVTPPEEAGGAGAGARAGAAGGAASNAELQAQAQVLEQILSSLSSSLVSGDFSNLNRRQAAAIMVYLTSSSSGIVDLVKTFGRRLKNANIVRYLEVQMLAIKSHYMDNVSLPMQQLGQLEKTGVSALRMDTTATAAATATGSAASVSASQMSQHSQASRSSSSSQEEGEAYEVGDYLRVLNTGCRKVEALAARLAQSLGVTADQYIKQEGQEGKAALSSFLSIGVHWALQDKGAPENTLLLDSLAKYTRYVYVYVEMSLLKYLVRVVSLPS